MPGIARRGEAPARLTLGRWRTSRRGYTLVALMVGLTVMLVLIAAVLPLASVQAQRDREEELIFRGLQIAEGIRVFRRKYGRYPTTVKEMFEVRPRTLRKLWKDPMTKDGQWGIISIAGAPLPGQAGMPGGVSTGLPTPTPGPTPGAAGSPGMPGGPPGALGPVMGVYSLSTQKGYRLYQGRETYNEWRFTEQTLGFGATGPETPGGLPGPGIGGTGPVPQPPGGGLLPQPRP